MSANPLLGFVVTQRNPAPQTKEAAPTGRRSEESPTPPDKATEAAQSDGLQTPDQAPPEPQWPKGLRYTYEKTIFYLTLEQNYFKLLFFDEEGQPAPSPFQAGYLDLKVLSKRTTGTPGQLSIPLQTIPHGLKAARVVKPPYLFNVGLRLEPMGGHKEVKFSTQRFNPNELGLFAKEGSERSESSLLRR